MQQSAVQKTPRIEVVDALRGMVILAILLLHNLMHFNYSVFPDAALQPHWLNVLDEFVKKGTFFLFFGKSFPVFVMLFGFTFSIQYVNQQMKGNDFGCRFLWRLFLLIGFATINAAFFPEGDVLLKFSLFGVVLVIVRKWSDKAVFITACILFLGPYQIYQYIMSLLSSTYVLPDLEWTKAMFNGLENVGNSNGNFWRFVWCNITYGQASPLMYILFSGLFFQQSGLFLLGLLIGRRKLFVANEKNNRFWRKALIISIPVYLVFHLGIAKFMAVQDATTQQTIGALTHMWQSFSFTVILVASFVLLYQKNFFNKLASPLRFYGKMSLTNYVCQSIIGAFIYFPIGLNLAPHCGYTFSFLIAIVVFFAQVFFCKWWLKNHKQGILEGIWHKLTWIRK